VQGWQLRVVEEGKLVRPLSFVYGHAAVQVKAWLRQDMHDLLLIIAVETFTSLTTRFVF
jgi:hypothetical protein